MKKATREKFKKPGKTRQTKLDHDFAKQLSTFSIQQYRHICHVTNFASIKKCCILNKRFTPLNAESIQYIDENWTKTRFLSRWLCWKTFKAYEENFQRPFSANKSKLCDKTACAFLKVKGQEVMWRRKPFFQIKGQFCEVKYFIIFPWKPDILAYFGAIFHKMIDFQRKIITFDTIMTTLAFS